MVGGCATTGSHSANEIKQVIGVTSSEGFASGYFLLAKLSL